MTLIEGFSKFPTNINSNYVLSPYNRVKQTEYEIYTIFLELKMKILVLSGMRAVKLSMSKTGVGKLFG